LTAHIDPDEITQYLSGDTPPLLTLRYDDCSDVVAFLRSSDGLITAKLRFEADPSPFNIKAAIAHSTFDVPVSSDSQCYVFTISKRSHLRSVISLACCHLSWHDDDRIHAEFSDAPVA